MRFCVAVAMRENIVITVFRSMALMTDKSRNDFYHQFKFAFWFALAGATRSNGTVNCGFIAFYLLSDVLQTLQTKQPAFVSIVLSPFKVVILCGLVLMPFVLFNWYGFITFCTCSFVFYDLDCNKPLWCKAPLPLIYNHVQKDIWGLGLFSYYQIKKLPNFLLASPVVALSFFSAYNYLMDRREEIMYLGLVSSPKKTREPKYIFSSRNVLPFYFHLLFLVFFALLFMHVEVVTRLVMSSTPVIYWTVTSIIMKDIDFTSKKLTAFSTYSKLSSLSKFCLYYFFSYLFLGILLHCNFYPWT